MLDGSVVDDPRPAAGRAHAAAGLLHRPADRRDLVLEQPAQVPLTEGAPDRLVPHRGAPQPGADRVGERVREHEVAGRRVDRVPAVVEQEQGPVVLAAGQHLASLGPHVRPLPHLAERDEDLAAPATAHDRAQPERLLGGDLGEHGVDLGHPGLRAELEVHAAVAVDPEDAPTPRVPAVSKKLRKTLTLGPSEQPPTNAHDRMTKLAAVLGVANATVRRTPPQPWQRLDHLRLAGTTALRNLLLDGVAAAMVRRDLIYARSQVGNRAEELRITPVLLAWLCCELRIQPPGPPRRTRFGAEKDLTDRAVWIALFPTLDRDQWSRLLDMVISSDSSTEACDWYDAAMASAAHLRSVLKHPENYRSNRARAEPGDLVLFGRDTLRVVQSDIGGPRQTRRVRWLELGDASASRQFDRGALLLPTAWGSEA